MSDYEKNAVNKAILQLALALNADQKEEFYYDVMLAQAYLGNITAPVK